MSDPTTPSPSGLRIAKVSGIPIYVGWGTLLIAVLLVWILIDIISSVAPGYSHTEYIFASIAAALLFLFSLLVHELSHSLVAKFEGVTVHSIVLWFLGGTSYFLTPMQTAGATFLVSVVGPVSSFILGILFLVAFLVSASFNVSPVILAVLSYLFTINIALGIFNLIPAAPLDGGRVLRSIIWKLTNSKLKGVVVSSVAGQILGFLFIVYAIFVLLWWNDFWALWYALVGMFVVSSATAELRAARSGYLDNL